MRHDSDRRSNVGATIGGMEMESCQSIQSIVEEIPGAILNDEDVPRRKGEDNATPVFRPEDGDPGLSSSKLLDDFPDDVEQPEPQVVFEVPPAIDDAGRKLISDEQGNEIREHVRTKGVDALAWYVSFHIRRQPGI